VLLGLIVPGLGMLFGFIFNRRYPKRFAAQLATEGGGDAITPSFSDEQLLGEAARRQ
jgi:hypothetical protein